MKKSTALISCVMATLVIISVALVVIEKQIDKPDTYSSTVVTTTEIQTTLTSTAVAETQPSTTLTSTKTGTSKKVTNKSNQTTSPTTTASTSNVSVEKTTKKTIPTMSATKTEIIPFELKERISIENEMMDLVNAARASEGLAKLQWDDNLYGVAIIRSKECAELWSHTRPNGESYASVFYEHHLEQKYMDVGENLAKGPKDKGTAQALFDALMASPGHKANILKAGYTHCGIAAFYEEDKVYVAQNFGTIR